MQLRKDSYSVRVRIAADKTTVRVADHTEVQDDLQDIAEAHYGWGYMGTFQFNSTEGRDTAAKEMENKYPGIELKLYMDGDYKLIDALDHME